MTATTATADTGGEARRRSISLGEAAREFWRWQSPWIIGSFLAVSVSVRLLLGGWTLTDLWWVLGLVAIQPFVEWVLHVTVLHWRPRRILGRLVDPLVSRKHREHHLDPRDTELVFIPTPVLLWLIPIELAVAWLVTPRIEVAATYAVTIAAIGLVYEWSHYLIHSDYRPKTRVYRALWRNHRLHHYKNERYWFTVSNPLADHVLGTAPDPASVESSPSARDLLGTGA